MRKQERPAIADPVMEFDFALGGFGLEVRGDRANLESHVTPHFYSTAVHFAVSIKPRWPYVNKCPEKGQFLSETYNSWSFLLSPVPVTQKSLQRKNRRGSKNPDCPGIAFCGPHHPGSGP